MLLEIRIATEKEAAILSQLGRDTYTEAFGGLFKGYAAELEQYLNETFALQKSTIASGGQAILSCWRTMEILQSDTLN